MSDWDAIVGHGRVVAALRRAVVEERPHHAYLLLGPQGIGKALLAQTFTRSLLCDSPQADRPCGNCAPCGKVLAGSHPDAWAEVPSGKSNTITSDQITELQRRLSYRKLEGRYRVIIIDGAGTMNTQAQNKLLKTLEEPPPETILVLCALHPTQLLVTVRSRCQKLALAPAPAEALAAWLESTHEVPRARAVEIAHTARGLPGRALELLDPDSALERTTRLEQLSSAVAGDREAIDALVRSVDRDRGACREVLGSLQELLRDAMVDACGGENAAIHPDYRVHTGLLAALGARQLADRVGRVEASRERLKRNVDPAGLLEDILVYLSVEAPRP